MRRVARKDAARDARGPGCHVDPAARGANRTVVLQVAVLNDDVRPGRVYASPAAQCLVREEDAVADAG